MNNISVERDFRVFLKYKVIEKLFLILKYFWYSLPEKNYN